MADRSKSKKKTKFYAVSVGRTVGIFDNWPEASKSVTGFPCSSHQSFTKLCKAEEAMHKAGIFNPPIFRSETKPDPEERNYVGSSESQTLLTQSAPPTPAVNTHAENEVGEKNDDEEEEDNDNDDDFVLAEESGDDRALEAEERRVDEKEEEEEVRAFQEVDLEGEDQTKVKEIGLPIASRQAKPVEEDQSKVKEIGLPTSEKNDCTVCKGQVKSKHGLKCSDCGKKIHWICSQLPAYQIGIFTRSQRKFTCATCAQAFADDKMMEIIENDLDNENTEAPQAHNADHNDISKALKAHDQGLRTMVANMELALSNIAEQMAENDIHMAQRIANLEQSVKQNTLAKRQTENPSVIRKSMERASQTEESKFAVPTVSIAQSCSYTSTPHRPWTDIEGAARRLQRVWSDADQMKETADTQKEKASNSASSETSSTQSDESGDEQNIPISISASKKKKKGAASSTREQIRAVRVQKNTESQPDKKMDEERKKGKEKRDKRHDSTRKEIFDVSNTQDIEASSVLISDEEGDASSSRPTVILLHDSILRDVESKRLGDSYGLTVKARTTSTVRDIAVNTATDDHPEAYVIHVGVNDLKEQTAEEASKHLIQEVKTLMHRASRSKIIISKVAPNRVEDLEAERELFNALVHTSFHGEERVTFVSHETLQASFYFHKDDLHVTPRGASVLAANIGRHVSNLFWSRPSRRGVHRPPPQQRHHVYQQHRNYQYRYQQQPRYRRQQGYRGPRQQYRNSYHSPSALYQPRRRFQSQRGYQQQSRDFQPRQKYHEQQSSWSELDRNNKYEPHWQNSRWQNHRYVNRRH